VNDVVAPVLVSAAFLTMAVLQRGTIAPGSRITRIVRAQYVTGSPWTTFLPFAYRRLVSMGLPLWLGTFLLAWLPLFGRDQAGLGWTLLFGAAGCWIIAVIAFIWPRPFLPQWIKDVDDGRDLGLDVAVLARVERANAPLSPRAFKLTNGIGATALLVALILNAPGPVLLAISIALGFLWRAQYSR
jgi:hypothetical protein